VVAVKILRLTAENVKKLKVVDITANAGMNQITGKNGSGKTSVLDSIWWALGGKDGIQAVPIRKGQEKAFIRLDLGELIVERRFNASGTTTLSVKNSEGAAYPSPQSMLDALVGSLSFDPLAFSGKVGIVLEDGSVVADNQEAAQ
jgi:DNA repair exonuclease SbcCD ATPase subunit